jgi:leucyl aminopeptidase
MHRNLPPGLGCPDLALPTDGPAGRPSRPVGVAVSRTASRDTVPEPFVPTLSLNGGPATKVTADVLLIGLRPGTNGGPPQLVDGAADITKAFGSDPASAFRTVGATGKAGQLQVLPAPKGIAADVVAAVGLGAAKDADLAGTLDEIRHSVGAAIRALGGVGRTVAVSLGDEDAVLAAAAEGAVLGGYRYDRLRTVENTEGAVEQVVVISRGSGAKATVDRARIVTRNVAIARDLVNTPPSHLTPAVFADRAQALARQSGCSVEVLDEVELAEGGYGGILGVGQGSVNPPRLVHVSHRPRKPVAHVALVGKGITFDTGGISIKSTAGMLTMKCDMAGAAAVLAAVVTAAELELPVRVDAWCCMAENMPSGSAQRPSDVLTMRNGTTCEVLNTDAEGRLVLADGLARASEESPDVIIDVATLTGACVVALGTRTFGVFATDDELADRVVSSANRTGEPAWHMPLLAENPEKLKSKVADVAHWSTVPAGGASTAATFLSRFVTGTIPWAHLDIAGPAFVDMASGHLTPGGTGVAVRPLVELITSTASPD